MRVHADFTQRASVLPDQHRWLPSPQPGVTRVMLDRLGAEHGHATSLVRYAAGSSFPVHQHPGGEEILVLDGAFCEGAARYPAGWYLRNPPGSSHQPSSPEGALLFVKLCQMPPGERRAVRLDSADPSAWSEHAGRPTCLLFQSEAEQALLQDLAPGQVPMWPEGGRAELLVLSGALELDRQALPVGSWWRSPVGDRPALRAAGSGARVFLKTTTLTP